MVPSVRTFVVAVPSQESAVRPVMVVFIQGSWLESIDVAAVEVCFSLLVVVVPSCGRWSTSVYQFLVLLSLQIKREGSVFGDRFVMS